MPRAKKALPPLPQLTHAEEFAHLAPFPAGGACDEPNALPFFLMSILTIEEMGVDVDPFKDRHNLSKLPVISTTKAFAFSVFWLPEALGEEFLANPRAQSATLGPEALRFRQNKAIFQQPLLRRDEEGLGLLSSSSSGDARIHEHFGVSSALARLSPIGLWVHPCIRVQRAPTPAQALLLAQNICALPVPPYESTPYVLLGCEAGTPFTEALDKDSRFERSSARDPQIQAWVSEAAKQAEALLEARQLTREMRAGAHAAAMRSATDSPSEPQEIGHSESQASRKDARRL